MASQPLFLSTVTQRLSFRAGHVVANPHVHYFVVTVSAHGPVATEGPTAGMGVDVLALRQIIADEVALVLGHRMSVWSHESDEVRERPYDWPKDLAGPPLPELTWHVRPTVENLGRWAAQRIVHAVRDRLPRAVVTRVEVTETSRTSAIFEGCDLESLRNVHVPGPVAA